MTAGDGISINGNVVSANNLVLIYEAVLPESVSININNLNIKQGETLYLDFICSSKSSDADVVLRINGSSSDYITAGIAWETSIVTDSHSGESQTYMGYCKRTDYILNIHSKMINTGSVIIGRTIGINPYNGRVFSFESHHQSEGITSLELFTNKGTGFQEGALLKIYKEA